VKKDYHSTESMKEVNSPFPAIDENIRLLKIMQQSKRRTWAVVSDGVWRYNRDSDLLEDALEELVGGIWA